jgi:hypothetical protein
MADQLNQSPTRQPGFLKSAAQAIPWDPKITLPPLVEE